MYPSLHSADGSSVEDRCRARHDTWLGHSAVLAVRQGIRYCTIPRATSSQAVRYIAEVFIEQGDKESGKFVLRNC